MILSVLPSNFLRTLLYRLCFGYSVVGAQIGFGTVIVVAQADLDHCVIGRFNRFVGPIRVSIGSGASIETHNTFDCGDWAADDEYEYPYARELTVAENTRITNYHFFDMAGRFVLGRGSWIAGRGSQFWTHGVGATDRDISIGEHCYIGSAARFAPGSSIADNVVVGIGSVVTKRIEESHAIIAGSPAVVVTKDRGWKSREQLDALKLDG